MYKSLFFIISLVICFNPKLRSEENYWQQFVHYTMDVKLLPSENALIGEETIFYKNNSPDTLHKFYLHLYPNAYQNSESIRAQEAKKYSRKILKNKKR